MAENCEDFEQRLRQRFAEFACRRNTPVHPVLDTLANLRNRGWTAFMFGGIPRGVFDDGKNYRPRDLDLVFDDEHFPYFESAFEHCLEKRNSYGGLRLRINDMAVDAWPLSATWAFREGLVKNPSFENLPLTTFLNIDGLILEAVTKPGKKRRVYEAGFFGAWRHKILDINLRENPHPGTCLARTLSISKRYGFRISHRLSMYLWDLLATRPLVEFEAAQVHHYGQIEFQSGELVDIRRQLEGHLISSSLFPISLFGSRPAQVEFALGGPQLAVD
jgi:hypothetical protein